MRPLKKAKEYCSLGCNQILEFAHTPLSRFDFKRGLFRRDKIFATLETKHFACYCREIKATPETSVFLE